MREDLIERLPAVLEAVYGAYAIDWQLTPQSSPVDTLSAEALHLALVLAELLPDEPEVLGLCALVCLSESRRGARRAAGGRFVGEFARPWPAVVDPFVEGVARYDPLDATAQAAARPDAV